eukprot:CAMPEP_0182417106 /NCGR_PEP_ID=MMETSP1167-20130531/1520_1 /TAXON_ID=2988 /ORGANISM="Mallomonas Sp, Strain CCMP3275" /LENGTH=152 /DNA_ID=CAMNT_0024590413 /DNA_START=107 /DNA_END=565 /DNA_ORIENTATION=+
MGHKINGNTFLISVFDYEPSGLIIHAYNQVDSKEYMLPITEPELSRAGYTRTTNSLKNLIDTIILSPRGSEFVLQSSNPLINIQRGQPTNTDLDDMIRSTIEGVPSIHDLLVTGLVELCKVKPVGIDAVKWLGEWLLANNPNKPRVEGPDDE